MSENEITPHFWTRADEIIAIANEQTKESNIGDVSTSLLYAAARFNAFNVASSATNIEEMKHDKDEAIQHFCEQYRQMLIENLDDHIANFDDNKA